MSSAESRSSADISKAIRSMPAVRYGLPEAPQVIEYQRSEPKEEANGNLESSEAGGYFNEERKV
jgi:hypothetical protein